MKVLDANKSNRVRRIAGGIAKNRSAADIVRNYLDARRAGTAVMGNPTVRPLELESMPPVNPDLAPELYNMVPLMYDIPTVTAPFGEETQEPEIDYFSDDAIARRALKQRYAESGFRDNAVSGAGAQGAWQIMPITYRDYLGRGKGKAGDLNDPDYNRKVRDWVMKVIPRDLGEFYSEDDAPLARLAKIYGAYNWGAGNMRKYLRKQREAGVDISNDTTWVEGLNPETRRYIKYLALDEDIEDSPYTNAKFEESARKNGYMADGGRMYAMGGPGATGPAMPLQSAKSLIKSLWGTYLVDYANKGRMFGYPMSLDIMSRYIRSPYLESFGSLKKGERDDTLRRALFGKYFGMNPDELDVKPEEYLVKSKYRPSVETNPDAEYYTFIPQAGGTRWERNDLVDDFEGVAGEFKYGLGEDENGRYVSMYDSWDLNPFEYISWNGPIDYFKKYGAKAVELYDRIYEKDNPELYSKAYDYGVRGGYIKDDDENSLASGGKIRIKPENRGKFTALKKRTGHSASWFKAHGTPAQKKMAVFELNARKWKHGDGGLLDRYGDDAVREAIKKLRENRFQEGGPERRTAELLDEPVKVPENMKDVYDAASFVENYYTSDGYKKRLADAGLSSQDMKYSGYMQAVPDMELWDSYTSGDGGINIGLLPYYMDFPTDNTVLGKTFISAPISEANRYAAGLYPATVAAHEFAHLNPMFNTRYDDWYHPRRKNKDLSPYYGNDYTKVPPYWMYLLHPNKEVNDHDLEASENYSDLMSLRYFLWKNGIFDSMDPNAEFKSSDYDKIFEHEGGENLRYLMHHSKDAVIKAINEVASNSGNDVNFWDIHV